MFVLTFTRYSHVRPAALGATDNHRPLAISSVVVKDWSKQLKSYATAGSIATLL